MFGLMVAERTSLLLVGLKLLGLVFICLFECLLLIIRSGGRLRSTVMLVWSDAVLLCLFPVSCRPFSVLNSGVLFLPCRRTGLVTLGIDNLKCC